MSYIVLIDNTNTVVNRILSPDGINVWFAPADKTAVQDDNAQIGWIYDPVAKTFSAPVEPQVGAGESD